MLWLNKIPAISSRNCVLLVRESNFPLIVRPWTKIAISISTDTSINKHRVIRYVRMITRDSFRETRSLKFGYRAINSGQSFSFWESV